MTIPPVTWLLAAAALAGILALLVVLARGVRRLGLAPVGNGRLAVQAVLPLDTRRRLVLIRCDGREALLLTGGPQDVVVGWL
jgi:flagellar protein FliO/FliZ